MALYENTRPMADGRHYMRPAGFFGSLFGSIAAWNEARQARETLNRLNDRQLDDLGLTRADIDTFTRTRFR